MAQEQELEEEIVLLGQLSRHQWSIILKKEAQGDILEVAKSAIGRTWLIFWFILVPTQSQTSLFLVM